MLAPMTKYFAMALLAGLLGSCVTGAGQGFNNYCFTGGVGGLSAEDGQFYIEASFFTFADSPGCPGFGAGSEFSIGTDADGDGHVDTELFAVSPVVGTDTFFVAAVGGNFPSGEDIIITFTVVGDDGVSYLNYTSTIHTSESN